MIKLLIGGSPCTFWSVAQKINRETKAEGHGWELFKNYRIAKEKFKPDFFLYENNKSAAKPIKDQISQELGVPLMHINSALVSAQNRQRFYAFNWEVEQPEDRGILLKDILESGYTYQRKAYCLTANYGRNPYPADLLKCERTQVFDVNTNSIYTGYEVKNGKAIIEGFGRRTDKTELKVTGIPDGVYDIRKFTHKEMCRLQTMPDHYADAVSWNQAAMCLGNGWTAEVIIHILHGALKDVPGDEEIVVLSMYDGIGTGRYCLDKMGFTNVKYFAYEIDKYAKMVSASNYPDIIQLGDAFDVRNDDWSIEHILEGER